MKQLEAIDILKSGKNVFLTGEPGSGKTHTINTFHDWAREHGKRLAMTASTGIAATHIGGTTIHSFAGLGIKKIFGENDIMKILSKDRLVTELNRTDILVIDEVSMLDSFVIDKLDYVLKRVRESERPFGGIQIVFVGDFFQLPPVVQGTPEDPTPEQTFAFESQAWKDADLEICYLTEQHRTSEALFIDILRRMRRGELLNADIDTLLNHGDVSPSLILYTHNYDVDKMNEFELNKIAGEAFENCTMTEGIPFLKQWLIQHMLSPFKLRLKVGAKVMFTKNNFDAGYVNGTMGTVVRFEGRVPVVKIDGGMEVEVKRAEWLLEDEHGDVKARALQFPLRLAYAITVHKSQGMSLDSARIDLSKVFEYGQGYVAVSRVRSLAGLKLSGASIDSFNMHPKVVAFDKSIKPV